MNNHCIAILAEKPSVARVIAGVVGADQNHSKNGYFSGNGYKVTWAYGHLIGLAMPTDYGFRSYERDSLPMLPQEFKLIPRQIRDIKGHLKDDEGAIKQLNVIESIFNECSEIIVATDAGREGELIFRYIYEYLNCQKPCTRLWINSLTDKGVKEGFKSLMPINMYNNLYYAAESRSKADWLIGMNASQALSIAAGQKGLSLGRVQTPTLKMICSRYLENQNFLPQKFWQISITANKYGVDFSIHSALKYNNRTLAEEERKKIVQSEKITVVRIDKRETTEEPPLLYDLTALQQEANKQYGFSAEKTLQIAQSLYEARLITYPRTGSRYITDDVFCEIPELIRNLEQYPAFSKYALKMKGKRLNKHCIKPEKVTDHHALLITELYQPPFMSEDETRIYDMIAGRMLESFSEKCLKTIITNTFVSAEIGFSLTHNQIKLAGWREVFKQKQERPEEEAENTLVPMFEEGEILELICSETIERQTKPRPIHTDASILAAMETCGKDLEKEEEREALKDIGLGTPATRAGIIETLLYRQYIAREKKNLIPTDKGLAIYEIIKNMSISDVTVTAEWETAFNDIQSGKMEAGNFQKAIEIHTAHITNELLNLKLKIADNSPECICPKCKEKKVIFTPKVAKCEDENCGLIIFRNKCEKMLSDKVIIQLLENGRTDVIKGFKKKNGSKFDAALMFDKQGNVIFDFPPKKIK